MIEQADKKRRLVRRASRRSRHRSLNVLPLFGFVLAAAGCYVSSVDQAAGGAADNTLPESAAVSQKPCRDAGSPDAIPTDSGAADAHADDAASGCACTPSPSGVIGSQSLSCFCSVVPCLSYKEALRFCPDSPFPEENRIDIYAACNLIVVAHGTGFVYGSYVYDATTRALVGAEYGIDYNGLVCGATDVFVYQAGTLPPPDCAISESRPRCGDAG